VMQWLAAWWKQIVGPPTIDPWEDDPHIRAERADQHDRITKASEGNYYDQWNARWRESWRPPNHDA
jgi:hypothetical protein